MRILYIINSLDVGGAEILVSEIIANINSRGKKCDVLLLTEVESFLMEKLVKSKVNILSINRYSIYNPFNIFYIKKYMKKYDIIHVHLFPALYWASLSKILLKKKVILVYTEHSTSNGRRKYKILRPLEKFIYSKYDKIFCISDAATIALKKYLGKSDCISTINNGIYVDKFRRENVEEFYNVDLPGRLDSIKITQVSSFREAKDQDTVIRALSYLPKEIDLYLVGDGPRKNKLEQLATDLGVSNRVFFLGIREDIATILSSSDIVVVSSHREGFGLAAVEGMAAGKPVFASNIPGLSDVVNNKELLFEKSNYRDLANKVSVVLSNSEKLRELSQYCLERSKCYELSTTIDQYISEYNKMSNSFKR